MSDESNARDADAERLERGTLADAPFKTAVARVNIPDPHNPGMRIVGYRVSQEEAGLSDALFVLYARDAALREARAEIENLRSDAANDAGHIQAMKRGFDQLYEAIGIAPKGDHWPDYLFRVKTEVGFLREQEAVSAYREMRLWHEARYKEARDLAQDDGVAGAHAAAHYTAIEYCRSRETEQIPEHGDHAKPEPKEE